MTSLSFDVTLTYEVHIERTQKALAFYDQISQSHALVKSQEFLEFVVLTTISIPTIQPSMHNVRLVYLVKSLPFYSHHCIPNLEITKHMTYAVITLILLLKNLKQMF